MTFGWGVLIGVLGTISVESVAVLAIGYVTTQRKMKAQGKLG